MHLRSAGVLAGVVLLALAAVPGSDAALNASECVAKYNAKDHFFQVRPPCPAFVQPHERARCLPSSNAIHTAHTRPPPPPPFHALFSLLARVTFFFRRGRNQGKNDRTRV
jgi:hypothetical protein